MTLQYLQKNAHRMIGVKALAPKGDVRVAGYTLTLMSENDQRDEPLGPPRGVILHWQASNRMVAWDGYHFVITEMKDGTIIVIKRVPLDKKGKHLWQRNSGMYGVSFASEGTDDPVLAPTQGMQAAMSILVAELCAWKNINPEANLIVPEKQCNSDATKMWDTGRTIVMPSITSHQAYAQKDGYARWRWDIGDLLAGVRADAVGHHKGLKSKTITEWCFKELLQNAA